MDLKIDKINSANAKVTTTIGKDELQQAQDKIAREFAKKANIPGFRAGKVPVNVVKTRYKKEITSDAEQELVQKLFQQALKDLGRDTKDVVGEPVFKKFDKKGDTIDAEIIISFKPELKLDGFEECIPTHATPRVTKKDVDEQKDKIFAMVAPLKPIKGKRGLKKGDFALFDFDGYVDGKAFDGGKAENYTLEIGSGQFIPGFEDGMIGLKAKESKDINVTFPENYGGSELAGKDAVFKVTLHEIQAKELPETLDEETLKRLLPNEEKPTSEKLEEQIKEQVKADKLNKLYEEELKPKFVKSVVKKFTFDLPENIVEQELDMQVRQNWQSFSKEEIEGFQKDPKKLEAKRESYKNDAIDSVKLTFIVDELAQQKGISVDDQEVMQALYYEAMQQGQNPKEYVEMYQKQGVLPAVKMAMIEDKLFRSLFFDTKKEPKKTTKTAKKPAAKKEAKK